MMVEDMKESVKRLLITTSTSSNNCEGAIGTLELIDALQQLGVAYHFKEEIHEILAVIFENHESLMQEMKDGGGGGGDGDGGDLYATSLLFRLLRQNRFPVSQGVFVGFMDEITGGFKQSVVKDEDAMKGMLSLYEASFLATDEDNLLHEAYDFTCKYLRNALDQLIIINNNTNGFREINGGISRKNNTLKLEKVILNALEHPIHWTVGRLHARWSIENIKLQLEDEDDVKTYKNIIAKNFQLLLRFAKLDFNVVQSAYKSELVDLSRWWSDLGLHGDKLSFSRDRLVENFFWAAGWAEEPKFRRVRDILTKVVCLVTTMDDIYDIYASLDELQVFTQAIERWDATCETIESLPDCMKMCFFAIFNTTNDFAYAIIRDRGVDTLEHLRRAWSDLCKAYMKEAVWYHTGYSPTLVEYLDNGWVSISGHLQSTFALCASEALTRESLTFYKTVYPDVNIIRSPSLIFRLYDDLGTSSEEMKRGDVPKSVQLFMMQEKGLVSESEAREKVEGLIASTWRKLNGEMLLLGTSHGTYEESFEVVAVNLARNGRSFYQYGDGYGMTNGQTTQGIISAVIDPIPV